MEGYSNLRFKLQNERVSVYRLWQQWPKPYMNPTKNLIETKLHEPH